MNSPSSGQLQNILVWVLSCRIILHAHTFIIKRSPLELGYVTFPDETARHRGVVIFNKTSTDIDIERNSKDLSLPVNINKISHTDEWIPGQIKDHLFIPAHVHHIYLPVIISRTVIVKPTPGNIYGYFPRHFGGYGVGSYTGGQGAGHGFQIFFNS